MRKRELPDLNDPAIMRLILRLALPSVAGLSINAINQVVDAFLSRIMRSVPWLV